MKITEEVRRAVYSSDCKYWGHQPDFRSAFGGSDRPNPNDPHGFPLPVLRSPVQGQMPHVRCTRCGCVWLVIDEPGFDYDDAVAKVAQRMEPVNPNHVDPLEPKPVPGVGLRIPLAPGVDFDALPADHPAVMFAHQVDQESYMAGSHTEINTDAEPAEETS